MANPYLSGTNMEYVVTDEETSVLPLGTMQEFDAWVENAVNGKSGLTNMTHVLQSIKESKNIGNFEKISRYAPLFYYKAVSSVMTQDLHDAFINKADSRLMILRDAAAEHRRLGMRDKNEFVNAAENATFNWIQGSSELAEVYNKLRENRNYEYVNLVDDNSTILRQSQLNHDMMLRRKSMNQFLKIICIYLAIIILVGYINHIGYDYQLVSVVLIVVFVLFLITIITTLFTQRRMHSLNYNRLAFPGYPVMNEEVQNQYVGDCTDPSNMKSVKCTGLA